MAGKEQLKLAAREDPALAREYVDVEDRIGHTFKSGLALRDVVEEVEAEKAAGFTPTIKSLAERARAQDVRGSKAFIAAERKKAEGRFAPYVAQFEQQRIQEAIAALGGAPGVTLELRDLRDATGYKTAPLRKRLQAMGYAVEGKPRKQYIRIGGA